MARTTRQKIIRTLKISGWSVLTLIVSINLFILISGKFHLYKAIWNTVMQGRIMPSIHEYEIFYNRTVEAGTPDYWETHHHYSRCTLRQEDLEKFASISTESYLVIKNDSLLFEQYWPEYNNHTRDSLTNSFSVAKSVVSILIGIAKDEGLIESLDDPAAKYYKPYAEGAFSKITIRHLLTMSSGLNWDESSSPFSDNTEAYYGWDLEELLSIQEVIEEPGKRFNYQSGNTQILGFVLENATGMTVSEYASEKLWKKIGATSDALWNLDDENGHEKTFCCLYATSRDFARIGQLYLNGGTWKGKRIISEEYIKECITPANLVVEDGKPNSKYGLSWWLDNYKSMQIYYARGILGQFIICVPQYKLVIVRTGYQRGKKLETDHPEDLYWYIDAALAMIGEE